MDLSDIRERIDSIDKKILSLLEERFEIIDSVYEIKSKTNGCIFDRDREQKVIKKLKGEIHSNLGNEISNIYTLIMDLSKAKQQIRKFSDKNFYKFTKEDKIVLEKEVYFSDVFRFLNQIIIYDIEVSNLNLITCKETVKISLVININHENGIRTNSFIDMINNMFLL